MSQPISVILLIRWSTSAAGSRDLDGRLRELAVSDEGFDAGGALLRRITKGNSVRMGPFAGQRA